MLLDGIFASEHRDSSGESLAIFRNKEGEGIDVSTLAETGFLNYEHKSASNNDGSISFGQELVGKIVFCKKIRNLADCDNDREEYYWNQSKLPFVYGVARLFDGSGHLGAQALAAIIRDHHANGEKILLRFSIEGASLSRSKDDPKKITHSIGKAVAITASPCNRVCNSGILADPNAPAGFDKKPVDDKEVKNILGKIENPLHQAFPGFEVEYSPLKVVDESNLETKFKTLAKALFLKKALTAGGYNTAPSNLTGGSALQVEDNFKTRMKKAIKAYKPTGKFNKAEFLAIAKHYLPDVDPEYLKHFGDTAEKIHIKNLKKSLDFGKELIFKLESINIELKSSQLKKGDYQYQDNPVFYAGHHVIPGHAIASKHKYAILHEDPDFYYGVHHDKVNNFSANDLVKLPKSKEKTHYWVVSKPSILVYKE